MPEQAPMPRKAKIVPVTYKNGKGDEIQRYELRGADVERDVLLAEYDNEQEAQEALRKYEEGEEQ